MTLDWTRIELERTGGLAGVPVRVQVGADDDDAARWTSLLEGVDLGGLQPTGTSAGTDRFSYALRIEVGEAVHDLRCGEGALPAQLRPLVRELVRRGRAGPRPGGE